ncbi:hypothetical protein M3P05_16795 [Sansalvadorimonas sp. 2012CJ34-2]|uniref:Uracil-DNA glycosylase-like domain-containing protein n=1 Tax=Parendozoicomonas callyspongiae TaxID=2942213 RepID=A0ABT0PK08_9GAMM|nr:uracil-DNA glycosylase [Sansalvadorimonas sp. 2012CJ34-2]MCL6271576.1 hypothetical protein [Sansalvadorimonas sp. 2012CJ34-2]
MRTLEDFLSTLNSFDGSDTIYNPYKDKSILNNLRVYLEFMDKHAGKRVLLVGEAPGYKGCRITGIPFTSSYQLTNSENPNICRFKDKLVFSKTESENTAKIVWDFLSHERSIPLFWNSFPFHPHLKGKSNSNRAPTSKEIEFGVTILRKLKDIYEPEVIASIGRKGETAIKKAFPDIQVQYIRHPSYGGKRDFLQGMSNIM